MSFLAAVQIYVRQTLPETEAPEWEDEILV
jgi:hypothetical protein